MKGLVLLCLRPGYHGVLWAYSKAVYHVLNLCAIVRGELEQEARGPTRHLRNVLCTGNGVL